MKPEIISEAPLSIPEVKKELANVKKRDGELSFRSAKTEEYLQQISTISEKDADELKAKLEKLDLPRFKDLHIAKIMDLMPTSADQLKAVLSGYGMSLSAENIKKIIAAVKEYV
ncbi:hypothetical protein HZB02_06095 [Candidatus Woesearchaeota archaeon]|nr:hypothetical protein [Candidatus Woesearchaeota archaeon]